MNRNLLGGIPHEIDQLLSELFGTIVDFVDCLGKIVTGSGTVTSSGKRRGGGLRKLKPVRQAVRTSVAAQMQAVAQHF